MSDQINNQTGNSDNNSNSGNILKELSDIKYSLGINTTETKNMKDTFDIKIKNVGDAVNEIKLDVKEIRKNYINQEQHTELQKKVATLEDKTETLETSRTSQNVMMTVGIGILTLLTSILIWHVVK